MSAGESAKAKKLDKMNCRNKEIDSIIQNLYEDNISGKLSDERFSKLSKSYEQEQKELEPAIDNLEDELLQETCKADGIHS